MSEGELLALTQSEWRCYEQAAMRRDARRYAWECSLHGLMKSNKKPYTSADFLTRPSRKKTPDQILADFRAAFPKPAKS